MEHFAAILAGGVLGWALVQLVVRRRTVVCNQAGRLLTRSRNIRSSRPKLVILFVLVFVLVHTVFVAACRHQGASHGLSWAWTVGFFLVGGFTLLRNVSSLGKMWTELREKGVVCRGRGWEIAFMPWHRIRWCQWLDSPRRLSIYSFEPFPVDQGKVEMITEVLVSRVELRDSAGKVMNPDFQPSEPAPDDEPWHERRPFQFELRTVLLVMLVVSLTLAWCNTEHYSEQQRQASLRHLARFDSSIHGGRHAWFNASKASPGPSDDDLRHLAAIDGLRCVDLGNAPITDDGLAELARFSHLTLLDLRNTQITDDGLAHLRSLDRLDDLTLAGTSITDAGLVHLESLRSLSKLSLGDTQVTDAGVRRLRKALPNVQISR